MKYARIERERRFLLAELPPNLDSHAPSLRIVDRYIVGTRLRLRRMESADGQVEARKFTQKYDADDAPGLRTIITNMYLSEREYQLLAALDARVLIKQRYTYHSADRRFSIDRFEGALHGLILAEVEADSDAALHAMPLPDFARCDVTDDPVFTGGNLVTLSAAALHEKLVAHGL